MAVVHETPSDTVVLSDSVVIVKVTGAPVHKTRKEAIARSYDTTELEIVEGIDRGFDE